MTAAAPALNDRQRAYLLAIFETDQEREAEMRDLPYRLFQPRTKASEWRWLEYAEPPILGRPGSPLWKRMKEVDKEQQQMAAMTFEETEHYIPTHVEVGHELVVLAKTFVIENFTADVDQLTTAWLNYMNAIMPSEVVVHPEVDPLPTMRQAAQSISCRLALYEAIWALIHANVIFLLSNDVQSVTPQIGYTTVVQRSGGHSGGWRFEQFAAGVPRRLWRATPWSSGRYRPLSDGSLYLRELGIANLHPLVDESLQEAVTCFRCDLYTPCLAMLTRAVEGAWTEMGLTIANAVRASSSKRADALTSDLIDPQFSLARRLTRVSDVYDQKELCEAVWITSGVKPRDLRQVAIWADQVRDSRNVLHYQAQPAMANTYEKVATLLIAAVPSMRMIYTVHDAAQKLVPTAAVVTS